MVAKTIFAGRIVVLSGEAGGGVLSVAFGAWCEGEPAATLEARVKGRVNRSVLVLNQNYEPLNVCNVRRAIVLVIDGKAEVLESHESAVVASTRYDFPYPSVIRLVYLIRRPRPRVKLTRREVFIRDNYTCQYCGRQSGDLTIDHIVPRSRGGPHSWDNLVSACKTCNHRKGGKSLGEARMQLRQPPAEPTAGVYYTIERRIDASIYAAWEKFLPGYRGIPQPDALHRLSPN